MTISEIRIIEMEGRDHKNRQRFVEIIGEDGLKGYAGPLDGEYQFRALLDRLPAFSKALANRDLFDPELNFHALWNSIYPGNPLEAFEEGKDPLTGKEVWQFHRTARHSPTGEVITAFSAVDNALWDLRGKAKNLPVYRLLGGDRPALPCYVSIMGIKTPREALEKARQWYDDGFKRHKCFLPYRPKDPGGITDNLKIAEAVRRGLPSDAEIMFDLSRLSDQADDTAARAERIKWACGMVKGLKECRPVWVEEPVSPDDLAGYEAVKDASPEIRLAAGEHIYTRFNLKPFLDRGLLDFVQCDPEWCGGISEFIEICRMIRTSYPEVRVIPHGHMILAATQCVASQPPEVSPMMEYLYQVIPERTAYLRHPVAPEAGLFRMPEDAGLGPEPDPERYITVGIHTGRQ